MSHSTISPSLQAVRKWYAYPPEGYTFEREQCEFWAFESAIKVKGKTGGVASDTGKAVSFFLLNCAELSQEQRWRVVHDMMNTTQMYTPLWKAKQAWLNRHFSSDGYDRPSRDEFETIASLVQKKVTSDFSSLSDCAFFGKIWTRVCMPLLGDGMGTACCRSRLEIKNGEKVLSKEEDSNKDERLFPTWFCMIEVFKEKFIDESSRYKNITVTFPGHQKSRLSYNSSLVEFDCSLTTPPISCDFRKDGNDLKNWLDLLNDNSPDGSGVRLLSQWGASKKLREFITNNLKKQVYHFDRIAADSFVPKGDGITAKEIQSTIVPFELPEGLAFLLWLLTTRARKELPQASCFFGSGFHIKAGADIIFLQLYRHGNGITWYLYVDEGWCPEAKWKSPAGYNSKGIWSNSGGTLLFSKVTS